MIRSFFKPSNKWLASKAEQENAGSLKPPVPFCKGNHEANQEFVLTPVAGGLSLGSSPNARRCVGFKGGQAVDWYCGSRSTASVAPYMTNLVPTLIVHIFVILGAGAWHLSAQRLQYTKRPDVENGAKVYKGGCIACHGADGKGTPMSSTVFLRPDTFPDFTDCAGTTPEPDGNWKAAIVHGGPSRGLSQIMPAFGDLLTDDQINDVIAYMRGVLQECSPLSAGGVEPAACAGDREGVS